MFVALLSAVCGSHEPRPATAGGDAASDKAALESIRAIHGGVGPWVVAGYRMGRYALARLGLPAGSFDLEVTHHSPRQVQYSCIADGAAAATGASLGRLNLALQESNATETRTTYRNRASNAAITLQVTPEFAARFIDVAQPQLSAAGRTVLQLPDAEIFHEISDAPAPEH
jgi:formylmethanofuran dehydrogenase subunit E